MTGWLPYSIHHLQAGEISAAVFTGRRHYIVVWNGSTPLGHYWLETETDLIHLRDHEAAIRQAIGIVPPALPDTPKGLAAAPALPDTPKGLTAASSAAGARQTLSVIICTRNRPADLELCIGRLLDSNDKDFELIVVDNASDDDRTRQVVLQFPGVRYVREDRKGLDIARNTGARAANNALIAYTDDDVRVDPDWTGHMRRAFQDPIVMAVTGLVIPEELRTRSQYIFERYWSFNKGYKPLTFDHRYFLDHLDYGVPAWDVGAGANMAFRREVFDLAGWFDERLDVGASGCSGDSEFWYRIMAEGWTCRYLPDIFVYHRHRDSDAGLKRQLFYYMRGHTSALLVQHERYGHKGELKRLYKGLPSYYWQRMKARLMQRHTKDRYKFSTLLTEVSGCISGWGYYQDNPPSTGKPLWIGPHDVLRNDVSVTDATLVTVVIPCYNHGAWLGAAIGSVLAQSWGNVEVVVVDDGSTDDTAAVCERYERTKYVRTERVGPCAARNIGVAYGSGNFVAFLDADDLLYPNAIELNLYYFGQYKNIAYVSGGHDRIDATGKYLSFNNGIVKNGDNYWSLLQGNYIGMEATVLYRRDLFFRFHFEPSIPVCEDYDLNLRIARQLPVMAHTTPVAAYRIHTGNRSTNRGVMLKAALSVLDKQEKWLLGRRERNAWLTGIENWHNYYIKM